MAAETRPLANASNKRQIAVAFPRRPDAPPHETASQQALTSKLAGVLGLKFIDDYQPAPQSTFGQVYYVPSRTLVRVDAYDVGERFIEGIDSEEDLFGGIVPHAFIATKAVTHPLFHPGAAAPQGWSHSFSGDVNQAVLKGTTAFSLHDATQAGLQLLALGPMRVKPVRASGGRGQILVHNQQQLFEALASQDEQEIISCGVVLEEHLSDVETFSVGQARAGGLTVSYVGTQSLTPDNHDELVYGGSNLLCVQGGYDELLQLPIDNVMREAVRLARLYDSGAQKNYPGLCASRRNYDVARGTDSQGRMKTGVLEQSWRAGGASFAEACALQMFRARPEVHVCRAYTCERYGEAHHPPADAEVFYRDTDPEVGFITKYGAIKSYGDAE